MTVTDARATTAWFDLRPLLRGGAILFLGMTVGNVGAYLLSLVVGRLLGPADFGSFVSLVAVGSMATIPAAALATVGAKFVSTYVAEGHLGRARALDTMFNRIGLLLGVGFLVGTLAFSGRLQSFLNLESRVPVIVLGFSFLLSFALLVARGLLQGLQRFTALAWNTGLEPILKLVAAVVFIRLGFAVNGALAGLAVAFVSCYLLVRFALRSLRVYPAEPIDRPAIWRYALPTIVSLIALAMLSAVDVVLVKHYFPPTEAGLYAGLATVSKIMLFVSAPLVTVMFPLITTKVSTGEKHWPLLAQTLALIAVVSIGVLTIFTAFPTTIVRLLFGSAYLAAASYLPFLSLAILFFSIATVFVNYFLSIGLTRVSWLVSVALLAEIGAIATWHATLGAVITDLTAVFAALLTALGLTYLLSKRQQLRNLFESASNRSRSRPPAR